MDDAAWASREDRAVDAAIGQAMGGTIRQFAGIYLFAAWMLLAITTIDGFGVDDLAFPQLFTMAVVLTLVNGAAMAIPWQREAGTRRGQVLMEAYAVVHIGVYASIHAWMSNSPVLTLAMLTVAALGAIYARTAVVAALVAIPVAAFAAATQRGEVLDFATVGAVMALGITVWVTRTAGRAHRATLQTALDANAVVQTQARQLAVVTQASRGLQDLKPDVVLKALVDATADLGWDSAGIYVPAPDGAGFVFGAHRNIPQDLNLGPQEPIGVFGEIARTGLPVAWPLYLDEPDANRKYDGRVASAAGAPILVHGVPRGALVTGASESRQISAQDLQTLELLANQAGRALELADEFARQQQTVAELERVNEIKQDFLATVSHELRTPLAVVLGMAETMDHRWDQLPEPMRRTMTTRMHTNAAGLENVIEALLDFSRLERGIVQPRRADVALLDLVEGVVLRLETLTDGHDLAIVTGPHAGRGEAFADPLLIERVVENLIVNACRHTPKGTTVRVHVLHDGPNAVIEVEDNGPGIPADEVTRLGERFFRGGDPNTRSTRGLGLGLAFCGEVLAMHDSRLDIDSTPGVGSNFSFALARGRTDDR